MCNRRLRGVKGELKLSAQPHQVAEMMGLARTVHSDASVGQSHVTGVPREAI